MDLSTRKSYQSRIGCFFYVYIFLAYVEIYNLLGCDSLKHVYIYAYAYFWVCNLTRRFRDYFLNRICKFCFYYDVWNMKMCDIYDVTFMLRQLLDRTIIEYRTFSCVLSFHFVESLNCKYKKNDFSFFFWKMWIFKAFFFVTLWLECVCILFVLMIRFSYLS